MELQAVVGLFRKWLWLLLLGAVLAGGAAYMWRSARPDKYEASVIIAVGTTMEIPNPDSAFIRTGADLARTYAVLATTYEVLQAAVEAGPFPIDAFDLRKEVSASVITDTPLVVLKVTYTDPQIAADIANALANQLVLKSPSYLTEEQQSQLNLAKTEIARLNDELKQSREELAALDNAWSAARSPEEIAQLRDQRYTLSAIINEKSSTLAEFSAIATKFEQRSNSLQIVEHAQPPTEPIGIGLAPIPLAGVVIGGALALLLALAVEYFDHSIRSPARASEFLSLPVLATIGRFGRRRDRYPDRLIAYLQPESAATEAYRTLRTNLLFSPNGNSSPKHAAYVITSPGANDGKSTTAANLAVTMAFAGLRVLLIDADLRRPTLHHMFGLENTDGLSTLALTLPPADLAKGSTLSSLPALAKVAQETCIPGLRVITSGPPPNNPAELLISEAMQQWIRTFKAMTDVDVVLFDTPAVLSVTDGPMLAAIGGLPVILVVHAQQTDSRQAIMAKEQIGILKAQVVGVVLNSAAPQDSYYYRRQSTKNA